MKLNKLYIGLLATAALLGNAACSEDNGPAPTVIDGATVTTEARPGEVILRWITPAEPNYYYVKAKYNVPGKGECMRTASVYSDSLLVDGLYAKYGPIDFTLTTVTREGEESAPFVVTAQAGKVAPTINDAGLGDKFALTGADLWTDSQESSEGPIANLVDGNNATHFHMSWSAPTPFPHYIVVDLKKEVQGVKINYVCRDNQNGDNPGQITLFGSNEFDRSLSKLSSATQFAVLTGLPNTRAATYESANYINQAGKFRYLWIRIDSATSGKQWVALAELGVTEVLTKIVDPEAE